MAGGSVSAIAKVPIYRRGKIAAWARVDAGGYFDWLSSFTWYLTGRGYAQKFARNGEGYPSGHSISMQRLVMGLGLRDKRVVHHINEDPLDNRIENLMVLSQSDHMRVVHHPRRIARSYQELLRQGLIA